MESLIDPEYVNCLYTDMRRKNALLVRCLAALEPRCAQCHPDWARDCTCSPGTCLMADVERELNPPGPSGSKSPDKTGEFYAGMVKDSARCPYCGCSPDGCPETRQGQADKLSPKGGRRRQPDPDEGIL